MLLAFHGVGSAGAAARISCRTAAGAAGSAAAWCLWQPPGQPGRHLLLADPLLRLLWQLLRLWGLLLFWEWQLLLHMLLLLLH